MSARAAASPDGLVAWHTDRVRLLFASHRPLPRTTSAAVRPWHVGSRHTPTYLQVSTSRSCGWLIPRAWPQGAPSWRPSRRVVHTRRQGSPPVVRWPAAAAAATAATSRSGRPPANGGWPKAAAGGASASAPPGRPSTGGAAAPRQAGGPDSRAHDRRGGAAGRGGKRHGWGGSTQPAPTARRVCRDRRGRRGRGAPDGRRGGHDAGWGQPLGQGRRHCGGRGHNGRRRCVTERRRWHLL